MLYLEVRLEDRLERIPLRTGESVLGRDPQCDVVVEEASISRRHARLIVGEGMVRVQDLGVGGHGEPERALTCVLPGEDGKAGRAVVVEGEARRAQVAVGAVLNEGHVSKRRRVWRARPLSTFTSEVAPEVRRAGERR